jgi:hypothetical protein
MINDRDLDVIFDRIAKLTHTEEDIQTLRQSFQALEGQNTLQIGKYIFNIAEGRDIHIGDTTYQGTDAETIRAILREEVKDLLQNQISAKQPDYATWKIEQNKHFSDSLKSSKQSFAAFKQIIDIKSQNVKFIKRQELFARLDNWYSSWNTPHQIFTVLGEEGDGKTWGVAYWLEQQIQKSNDFPAVIFLPSNSKIDREPVDIVSEIVARMVNRSSDICEKSVKSWLDRLTEQHPILLLVLDGINEHHKFPLWLALINALNVSPYQDRVAVLITCRQEYWQSNSPRYLQPEIYSLPAYSEAELTEALQINHLNHSEIPKNLIPLISKPRYFDLMVKYRERIAASGDITVQRLIYEDWRDRFDRKPDTELNDAGFQSLIQELAAKHIEKVKLSELEIVNTIPSIYDKLEIFNEIKSSGIIKGKKGQFKVDKNFLVHGFGLLLVEELVQAVELGDSDLNEVLAQWLEPHAAMDIKGLICQAASLIALEDADISLQVKVALLDAWVSSQNPSKDMEQEFIAYLPLAPEAYIELAEIVWSDAINNAWAQELLMSAFKRWLNHDRVLTLLTQAFERWLGFVHRLGFDPRRQSRKDALLTNEFLGFDPDEDDSKNTALQKEINDRLEYKLKLGKFSFHGYCLTAIEDDGLLRLGRVSLALISLLPRKAFIRAITIGCLAEVIINHPTKCDLFKWVLITARKPVWDEINTEVTTLLSLRNLLADRAAHRLLSFIGDRQAEAIWKTLPDDIFPVTSFIEEHNKNPCHSSFAWSEDECEICLIRTDVQLHIMAIKVKPYCLNPTFSAPQNLGIRLQPLLNEINENLIWSSHSNDIDTINYGRFEPAFCAYAHHTIADKIRKIVQGINTRSGESLRQLCFKLLDHYLLFDQLERKYIYQVWLSFDSQFDQIDDLEEVAESHLFRLVLRDLDAEQQLQCLIDRSEKTSEQIAIQKSFKLFTPDRARLLTLFENATNKELQNLLWFISKSSQNLSVEILREFIYPQLKNSESLIRRIVLSILYLSESKEVIQDFLLSSWTWNSAHHDFENHWGNLLLCKYGTELSYSSLSTRIDPDYLGILVMERGLRQDEIGEFARFLDRCWDKIEQSPTGLPVDLPLIKVVVTSKNNSSERPSFNLSDKYFSSSLKSTSRNYHWGGINRGSQFSNNSSFVDRYEQGDNYTNNLSRIANDFFKQHNSSDNPLLLSQIPLEVLSQIIIQYPELIDKWLKPIDLSLDEAKREKIISLGSVFYQSLCAALFQQAHVRAIELYSFICEINLKLILHDSDTNICFLDSALFQIDRNLSNEAIWQKQLEDCRSDAELMEISISAQQGGKVTWLEHYADRKLTSDIPLNLCYGLTILGFIDTNFAHALLTKQVELQPDSWRRELAKLSLNRWQQNSWSKHWFKSFLQESNPDLAWSQFRLFLRCVDRRYWLWQKDLINDISAQPHSHLSRNLEFLEDNIDTIRNNIKTNEKQYQDTFLGHEIKERQAWPFL